jgi:hypothetical protein
LRQQIDGAQDLPSFAYCTGSNLDRQKGNIATGRMLSPIENQTIFHFDILLHIPVKTDNFVARHEYILRQLQEAGSVVINDLCTKLGASIATIRRDLENLEGRSMLRRTRGGAVPIGPLFYEPFRHDASFQDKLSSFA